jgi:Protein of unknown function (DUF2783)
LEEEAMKLRTDFNLGSEGDEIFAELIEAHRGLDADMSAAFDARLILILVNHIGDAAIVRAAIAATAQR